MEDAKQHLLKGALYLPIAIGSHSGRSSAYPDRTLTGQPGPAFKAHKLGIIGVEHADYPVCSTRRWPTVDDRPLDPNALLGIGSGMSPSVKKRMSLGGGAGEPGNGLGSSQIACTKR